VAGFECFLQVCAERRGCDAHAAIPGFAAHCSAFLRAT
jgi:hypothetical protein